jgi:glycosidase
MLKTRSRFLLPLALALAACAPGRAPQGTPAGGAAGAPALYEVFVRDFSPAGDFRGVIAGLDRIAATGANVVWLMPIHPIGRENRKAPLGSSYAVADYRAVNPDYGTPDDFRALVNAVHARGMKVILDWVPNHTAWDHAWTREHPEFYLRDAQGKLSVPRDNDGKLTDWTDVADLDYANPRVRYQMIAAMEFWLDEYRIDGFRVDVAGMVPDDFWRDAIPRLRSGRDILLLAEWGEPKMHELGFDLTYGWDSYHRLKAVWRGESAADFIAQELEEQRTWPSGARRIRFTTNHDETAWDSPPVTLFGGPAGARAAFAAIALLPGVPLLYNGQEVESPQQLGLFAKEPVAWEQPGADSARAWYRRVVELARRHPALRGDDVAPVETNRPDDVIAYARGPVLVLVNTRDRPVELALRFPLDRARVLLGSRRGAGGLIALPPFGVLVADVPTRW